MIMSLYVSSESTECSRDCVQCESVIGGGTRLVEGVGCDLRATVDGVARLSAVGARCQGDGNAVATSEWISRGEGEDVDARAGSVGVGSHRGEPDLRGRTRRSIHRAGHVEHPAGGSQGGNRQGARGARGDCPTRAVQRDLLHTGAHGDGASQCGVARDA